MSKVYVEIDTVTGEVRRVDGPAGSLEPATPLPSWRTETGFPKAKEIGGATFNLTAPINPMWRPSSSQQLMGQQGREVWDPGLPAGNRSPAGYPAHAMDGTMIPFDDVVLANDEAVEIYLRRAGNQGNQGGLDAERQATLQHGQTDIKRLSRPELEGVLEEMGRNGKAKEMGRIYGPNKLMRPLFAFMSASGISDIGQMSGDHSLDGIVVPPEGWPELGDMTVDRAKYLAGLA